ncbi:MAG: transposase [Phycisphaerales bacterium]|nr:transposase [Phycisphaerales bacterium]
MERELFSMVRAALRRVGRRRCSRRQRYTDGTIVAVYYWAVINDRPTCWACKPSSWPRGLPRGGLPSQSVMSRRLRSIGVRRLLARLEELVLRKGRAPALVYMIDGKPMPIANHSADPHARYGRAVGSKSRGYKLHLLMDVHGTVWGHRVAAMNADERTMGRRLVRDLPGEVYLLADANYDSNKLYAAAATHGVQGVIPRRYGPGKGTGHRRHHPARLRSRDMLESPFNAFGLGLHELRRGIERFFGTLSASSSGLTCLPAWVRTHPRVRPWVQAKLVINQLRANRRALAAVAA